MNKRAVIIIATIIVAVMLIVFGAPLMSRKSGGNTAKKDSGNSSEVVSTEDKDSHIQGAAELMTEEQISDSDKKTEQTAEESDQGSSSVSDSQGSSGSSNDSSGSNGTQQESGGQASGGQGSGGSTSNLPTISFPYTIEGTDLVVEKISSYKGIFIEDGADKKVSDIAAIVLTNKGGDLEFAGIGIAQGTRSLGFSASQIPAGATVIIQEQNKAPYSKDPYYSATATTKPVDKFEMSEKKVTVKDNGKNGLTVTNISDKKLSEVKVYFKSYLPDEKVYVGGITYMITLKDLEPGTSTDVSASHYESKYSVVVEVQAK